MWTVSSLNTDEIELVTAGQTLRYMFWFELGRAVADPIFYERLLQIAIPCQST